MRYLYGLTVDGSVVYVGISKKPDGVVDYWRRRIDKGHDDPMDNLLRQCLADGQDIGVMIIAAHTDNKELNHVLRRYQDKWEDQLTRGRRVYEIPPTHIVKEQAEHIERTWPV